MPKSVFFFLTGRALPTQRRCAVRSERRGALPLPLMGAAGQGQARSAGRVKPDAVLENKKVTFFWCYVWAAVMRWTQ